MARASGGNICVYEYMGTHSWYFSAYWKRVWRLFKNCGFVKSGAFDNLGLFRSQLLASYEKIVENIQSANRSELEGQFDIFSITEDFSKIAPVKFEYPSIPEFTLKEKLMLEKESSGMYFSGHLLNDYSNHISYLKADNISDILTSFDEDAEDVKYRDRQNVCISGIIT